MSCKVNLTGIEQTKIFSSGSEMQIYHRHLTFEWNTLIKSIMVSM